MANNRLYLTCAVCGDSVTIARQSAGTTDWSQSRVPLDEYDDWLVRHQACGDGVLRVRLSSENNGLLQIEP